jgi:tRNA A-37 threonylcarbamoyl transferase component Bud32
MPQGAFMFRKILLLGLLYLLLSGQHVLKLLFLLIHNPILDCLGIFVAISAAILLIVPMRGLFVEEIVCTENGIQFWAKALHFRWLNAVVPWNQIKKIESSVRNHREEFDPDNNFFADRIISVRASRRRKRVIELNRLSSAKQAQLLADVDKWSFKRAKSESLMWLMRNAPKSADTASSAPSFTQLWEDDLANCLSATVYVPLEPGQLIADGRYRITKYLAAGGQAATYLATDRTNKNVVIKEFYWLDQSEMREKADELFKREYAVLRQIDHKRVAKVLDCFREGNRSYLVLEHIASENARKRVRLCGVMSAGQAVEIGLQVASILKYLHAFSPPILHRDLSPDNLIIDNDDCAYLIDFGAASESFSHATGTAIGKQAYVAPEQFRGRSVQASDIYGVGCTLYFLLTGQDPEPFSVSHPAFINPTVPASLDALIARCTVQNWPDRIVDAEDLQKELMAVAGMRKLDRVICRPT